MLAVSASYATAHVYTLQYKDSFENNLLVGIFLLLIACVFVVSKFFIRIFLTSIQFNMVLIKQVFKAKNMIK